MGILSSLAALWRSSFDDDDARMSVYPTTLPPALRKAARILEATPAAFPSTRRAQIGQAAIDALAAIEPASRAHHARDAGLPAHAACLGDQAHALLAFFIDDDALRPALGEQAIEVWLAIDRHACSAHALSRSDEWTCEMLVTLCRGVDPAEAFDAIADRFRRDAALRAHLGSDRYGMLKIVGPAVQDVRFVDLALEHLAREPLVMCRFLAAQGSPRAIDELCGVLERGEDNQLIAAFVRALDETLAPPAFVEAFARLLRSPAAARLADASIGSWTLYRHFDALSEALANDAVALARLRACYNTLPQGNVVG